MFKHTSIFPRYLSFLVERQNSASETLEGLKNVLLPIIQNSRNFYSSHKITEQYWNMATLLYMT